MPPSLDIYVLTKHRDRATIDRFLDTFVDRAANEERGDEELAITLRGAETGGETWEPALTLTHTIERGLSLANGAFTQYVTSRRRKIDRAILCFTMDSQLVLGLSIDDTDKLPQNERRARRLLRLLSAMTDASSGVVLVESPPPSSNEAFHQIGNEKSTIYFWKRQKHDGNSIEAHC